ncbi:hypothetical protein [Polynucleobacter brandtiae]|uniref:Uncharacterized protein n=1 Tax=Polynucleobacter brandtiae TaxID=1938816 RepID=A0A2M8VR40_9BURK|nr:hypothetical protein B0G85_0915 [Polynucleobacter brandtiae]
MNSLKHAENLFSVKTGADQKSELSSVKNFDIKTDDQLGARIPERFILNGDMKGIYSSNDFKKIFLYGRGINAAI